MFNPSGKCGIVITKVKCLNEDMEEVIVEGEELLARCLCHEINHLEGIVYVDKVEGELMDTQGGGIKNMKIIFMGTPEFCGVNT